MLNEKLFDAVLLTVTTSGTTFTENPFTFTITPAGTPLGIGQDIDVAPHDDTEQGTPLKVTVDPPCEDPKLKPLIVIETPASPADGPTLEMTGATPDGVTVKLTPFEGTEDTVTTTLPVVADPGTVQIKELAPQVPQVANTPLNFTVEPP